MIWHSNTLQSVLDELQVDPAVGLTTEEALAIARQFQELLG